MNLYFCQTVIGRVGIAEDCDAITGLYFETDNAPRDAEVLETEGIAEASRQLVRYLAGELTKFSLPLAPHGTPFMQGVWKALCEVPYGRTASYKDIAAAVGNPKAVRAVGLANNKNPIPIFIPCHRIIGSDRRLIGYRGGLALKKKLLRLEGIGFDGRGAIRD
jgi:methylated-DNA-[protein]-cysteine S-methyltransferase